MSRRRKARSRRNGPPQREEHEGRNGVRLRWIVGGVVALAVVAGAVILAILPLRQAPSASGAIEITASMAGFEPQLIRAKAGEPVRLTIINPDSPYHTDGGGWHQFRIEALGVDARVPPRARREVTLSSLAPGRYEFYCDVCCGGKDSPAMRGVVEVRG
ncbi:MAG: cupredoxin domain-containing protein [Armatimonadetes bacterium]|nr:cupredoxin domain-containing protein [Armatimonadota bacterium]